MSESVEHAPVFAWSADSPLALETYLVALESEQARLSIVESVLSQMRQRLDLPPREPPPPSADEIRALFARYQKSVPAPEKLISQMVVDMREE